MDDGVKQMTDKVEYMFLKKLITGLRDGSMEPVKAKEYAQAFLKVEPFQNLEDAKNKMTIFAQVYPEMVELKEFADAYHEEQKVDSVIQKMQEYIGQDKIDEAIQVAHAD
jgi:hypothetical protein